MNNGINQVNKVIHGDCLEVLKEMPDNSVDAVVTDPPYGLSKEPDIREVLTKWMNGEPYNHKHNGFMGKEWDSFVPHPDVWKEVYRVLKPGGHVLCFAGTRTQDLMTISLRLAGFEVRDVIEWLYFSGFPKSLDVGKAIDKRGGIMADFEEFRDACIEALQKPGKTRKELQNLLGNYMLSHYLSKGSQPAVPVYRDYVIIRDYLELGNRFDKYFKEAAEREKIGEYEYKRKGAGTWDKEVQGGMFKAQERIVDITAPATELAKKYDGFGTSLKPSHEPIILCRKPIEKNVAYNVEKWGCGAINVRACKIGNDLVESGRGGRKQKSIFQQSELSDVKSFSEGRFPANCVTTEPDAFFSKYFNVTPQELCKKASKKDRLSTWDGRQIEENKHPCVKPISLMSWLVRLITPPGGIVLDPFAGSGSTLVAAKREGFRYIGIELNAEYIDIIYKRLVDERGNVNER